MNYTQKEFEAAQMITSAEYCKLNNTRFEGQTRVDDNNEYTMYFSCNNVLYGIKSKL